MCQLMRDATAAGELQRLWNEPTAAACRRASRDTDPPVQEPELDEWESEGGTTAPREPT
jgi:hypothetical protein